MQHLERDAKAVRDQVDVFASESCSVEEIAWFLNLSPETVRAAMYLGPSHRTFRRAPRMHPREQKRKRRRTS